MQQPSTSGNGMRHLNMDWIRYLMASVVVVAHYNILVGTDFPLVLTSPMAVGVFFGLSGFLVYGTYLRKPEIGHYLFSRAKRILPAYWLIVIGFAVGLVLLSTCSVGDYFTSGHFWKYVIANMFFLNFIEPTLPGVFSNHVIDAVNGSLWTLKVEWGLYLTIPLFFFIIRRYRINLIKVVVALFAFSVLYSRTMDYLSVRFNSDVLSRLSYQFMGQMIYFYTGVLCYHYQDWIRQNSRQLYMCSIPMFLMLLVGHYFSIPDTLLGSVLYQIIEPIVFVTLAIQLSLQRPILTFLKRIGNCSYEMYLLHFPIIQIAVATGVTTAMSPIGAFLVVYGVVFLSAFLVNQLLH